MQNPKPAPFNVIPDDPTGNTWALPEGAISRFGKGVNSTGPDLESAVLSADGTYFVAGTGMGLWFYDVSSMSPIALWETERGLISSVDVSYDGKLIALGNWDGIVRVLDVETGECVTQMKRYKKSYTSVDFIAFSPDSKWIATDTGRGVIEVLDIRRSECISQPEPDSRGENRNVTSQLAFSPNGEIIAATCTTPANSGLGWVSIDTIDPQTYLWDPKNGERLAKFAGGEFTFSDDSRLLVCASSDNDNDPLGVHRYVSVWDIETKERIACFKEHENSVNSIVFSPCGKFIASSDKSGTLREWELETGEQQMEYTHYGIFSKRWLWKALHWLDKRIKLDNYNPGKIYSRIEPIYSAEGILLATVLRPHNNTIPHTHTIEVWNIGHRHKLRTIERKPTSIGSAWFSKCPKIGLIHTLYNTNKVPGETQTFLTLREPTCSPDLIAFSPEGKVLACNDGEGQGIVLWDVERKQAQDILQRDDRIHSFIFLPNGSLLAASTSNNTLKVWDVNKNNKPIAKFSAPGLGSPAVFAPQGNRIATVRSKSYKESIERTLYIWDLQSREKLELDTGHKKYIHAIAFSPDGNRLATACSDGIAQLWNAETGEEIAKVEDHREIRGITFSPCGNFIAGGWADEIRLWCTEKLNQLRTMPQPEGSQKPYALAFSPCSKYLASGTWWWWQEGLEKMAIRLWNVETGKNITTFWGHTSDVQSLAFSPDNSLLASGGHDGTILLWDLKSYISS